LDCGFHNWITDGNNWCSPYKGWQVRPLADSALTFSQCANFFFLIKQLYDNNPIEIYAAATNASAADAAYREGLILGSVAPLWSEQVCVDYVKRSSNKALKLKFSSIYNRLMDWLLKVGFGPVELL